MTSCLLFLAILFLIGLGLADSPLVILSLCSLVLSFVISFFCLFVSFSVLFILPYVFSWGSFLNIHLSYLSKKKKNTQEFILENSYYFCFCFIFFNVYLAMLIWYASLCGSSSNWRKINCRTGVGCDINCPIVFSFSLEKIIIP